MSVAAPQLDLQQITKNYFAAWEARDPDRIVALHTPDTHFQLHAGSEPAVGREAVREAFADIFEQWRGFSFETHRVLLGSDHWVLDWTMIARLKRGENGNEIEVPVRLHCLDVVTVSPEGLVNRKDTFVDVAQVNAMFAS